MIKVIIADDHQLVIDGLKSLLKEDKDIQVMAHASDGVELLDLLKIHQPDVIISDIDMPELNGIEATQKIKKTFPHIKVIALTMHNDKSMITKMSEAGASGYVLKNIGRDELIKAIKEVNVGKTFYSSEVTQTLLSNSQKEQNDLVLLEALTEREIEILKLIAEGLSNTQIGEKLFISPRTVDTHRTNLMKKIGANNIAALIRFAYKNGFIKE
jgi:two-component system, NarL family, nitrate/nitrite response regulator NarL